jgi:hypothetical protein
MSLVIRVCMATLSGFICQRTLSVVLLLASFFAGLLRRELCCAEVDPGFRRGVYRRSSQVKRRTGGSTAPKRADSAPEGGTKLFWPRVVRDIERQTLQAGPVATRQHYSPAVSRPSDRRHDDLAAETGREVRNGDDTCDTTVAAICDSATHARQPRGSARLFSSRVQGVGAASLNEWDYSTEDTDE